MSMRLMIGALLAATLIGFLSGTSFSEDPTPSPEEQMAEFMKAMTAMGTPKEEHTAIAAMAGSWDVDSKMWPMGKLEHTQGTSSSRMVFDGRYLQTEYNGTMQGKPYQGIGMMGYDNLKQRYWSHWYDNGSTTGYSMTGAASDDGKVITLNGTWEGPGGMSATTKIVWTIKDADTYTMEHFTVAEGKETRDVLMTYTRRKQAAPAAAPRRAGRRCCPPGTKGPGY